ncbi:MAG: hypothetical protein M1812_006665 [Candelaria pacifica]|nr:MAG: hypothetical protein M1812_006665 [Candelaria pacifica]
MDAVPLPKSATNTATSTSYLYAELLLNIRQVTVSLSLDPPSNKSTRVWLSSDRQSIGLSHDGHKSFLKLPAKVVYPPQSTLPNCQPNQAPVLAIPSPPSQEFSVRLPLADDTPRRTPVVQRADNEMPWSAAKLPISAQFQCCHCANILIPHEYIKTWKDLPSDNWAEMMDFWHCHKPSDHEHTENGETPGTDKGYAASNKLVAKTGVGFVDLCYFLIHPSDVVGIKVSNRSPMYTGLRSFGHLNAVNHSNPPLRATRRRPSPDSSDNGMVTDTIALYQNLTPAKHFYLEPTLSNHHQIVDGLLDVRKPTESLSTSVV